MQPVSLKSTSNLHFWVFPVSTEPTGITAPAVSIGVVRDGGYDSFKLTGTFVED